MTSAAKAQVEVAAVRFRRGLGLYGTAVAADASRRPALSCILPMRYSKEQAVTTKDLGGAYNINQTEYGCARA